MPRKQGNLRIPQGNKIALQVGGVGESGGGGTIGRVCVAGPQAGKGGGAAGVKGGV